MASGHGSPGSSAAPPSSLETLLLPGSASLLDCIDTNLVFQDTVERIYTDGNAYGDIPRGVFLIRGENVVLLGEIDPDREDALELHEMPVEDALAKHRQDSDTRQRAQSAEARALHGQGFCVDYDKNDMY